MIAATYTQGQKFEVAKVAEPSLQPGDALLRVEAASICGTDTKIVRSGHRKLRPGQRIVLGHEFVGTIVEGPFKGQRVGLAPNWGCGACDACIRGMANMCQEYSAFGIDTDGAHTECVRIPAAAIAQGNLIPLPDKMPVEEAALAEPLSCCLNGQQAARLAPGETVVIFGAGPMGLLHVALATACGAAQIIVKDPVAERLQKARELGATGTELDGLADVVITAAPVRAVAEQALALLKPFGRLCLFAGLPKDQPLIQLDANAIHYKNLCVTGTTGGCAAHYRAALNLIATRRVDVRPIISHLFPIKQVAAAYDVALSGKCLKVVMKC
jgi:L-iditol 2-dehydrogenase